MTGLSIGDALGVEMTEHPLPFTPRFDITVPSVTVAAYEDMDGRERLIGTTFGSMQWLWSEDDDLRFDSADRDLVAARFFVPTRAAPTQVCERTGPPVELGGLRADRTKQFGLPRTTLFCCDPEASWLRCVQDPKMLEATPDARVGIARDLALLVREERMIGWELNDPARYFTTRFAQPDPTPPSPATRLRLLECLQFISSPLVDDITDQGPSAPCVTSTRTGAGHRSCTRSSVS